MIFWEMSPHGVDGDDGPQSNAHHASIHGLRVRAKRSGLSDLRVAPVLFFQ
jgi:hypothetical protein